MTRARSDESVRGASAAQRDGARGARAPDDRCRCIRANAVQLRISARCKRATPPPSPEPFDPRRYGAQDGSALARILGGSTPPPGVLHRCFHTRFAEVLPRVPLIVSAAAQAEILNRAFSSHRPRVHVVEL